MSMEGRPCGCKCHLVAATCDVLLCTKLGLTPPTDALLHQPHLVIMRQPEAPCLHAGVQVCNLCRQCHQQILLLLPQCTNLQSEPDEVRELGWLLRKRAGGTRFKAQEAGGKGGG
jgi:hypothetical protein